MFTPLQLRMPNWSLALGVLGALAPGRLPVRLAMILSAGAMPLYSHTRLPGQHTRMGCVRQVLQKEVMKGEASED